MRIRNVLLMVAASLLLGAVVAACAPAPAPTHVPPTAAPPTAAPAAPTAPPTAVPPTAAPPTAIPPTATPAVGAPYKIGVVVSVTGPLSSLGVPERDSALMIMEQVNKAGGIKGPDGLMHKLEIIVEDDASDTAKAVTASKKLIEQDKVHILQGSSGSPSSIAMAAEAEKAKLPMISYASSSAIVYPALADLVGKTIKIPGKPDHTVSTGETLVYLARVYGVKEEDIKKANPEIKVGVVLPWIFKTPQENYPVAAVQVDYWKAKGIKKVASLGINNAFGLDSRLGMKALYKEAGIEILADELFQPGDKDFRAQLTKIKALNPEGLVVHATSAEGAGVTVQFRELGFKIPIVHNHGIGAKAFIDLAKADAEGVLFPIGKVLIAPSLPDADPQKKVLLQYIKDYTDYTKGAPISTFGGHAWDGIQMGVTCFGKAGSDAAKLRDCLEGLKNFIGISGIFDMSPTDHTGIAKASLVLVKIEKGTWVFVPPDKYKDN
jgi:branched-chain amino acid transport system substrate-binding protein